MGKTIQLSEHIICIDDDRLVQRHLEKIVSFPVLPFENAAPLSEEETHGQPIGIFLDVYLGSASIGLDAIPQLLRHFPYSPIIVMTGSNDTQLISDALQRGAADFVRKPLNAVEVNSRMEKARLDLEKRAVIPVGDITLDLTKSELQKNGVSEHITSKAMKLLLALMRSPEFGMTREELIEHIWGETKVCSNSLEQYLKKSRKHLDAVGSSVEIITQRSESVRLSIKKKIPPTAA